MDRYYQQVLDERDALAERLERLGRFLGRWDAARTVGQDEVVRMHLQQTLMQQYLDVLDDRIAHFGKPQKVNGHGAA